MSIAQFGSTSAKEVAAQINAGTVKISTSNEFSRLLNDQHLHAQAKLLSDHQDEAARRADATKTKAADRHPPQPAVQHATQRAAADAAPKAHTKTNDADDSDKTHASHHPDHQTAAATDAPAKTDTTPAPAPVPVPATAPLPLTAANTTSVNTPADSDATDTEGSAVDGNKAPTATAPAATASVTTAPATTAPTTTAPAATASATPASTTTASAQTATATTTTEWAATADTDTITDPAVAALTTLGLGRSAVPGAGTSVPPAKGNIAPANVSVSVTKAPAAVKLGALTTALPLDVNGEAPAPANPTTVALNPAAASAAANAAAAKAGTDPVDPNADAPAAAPADLDAALASAMTAAAAEPPSVTVAAATPQHDSLFAQGGSEAMSGTAAPTSGTTPTLAGFATVNAGTTVSRAETVSTSSQNGQTGQEPLPLPAEQLAIAVSRNAGRDGSQNFTIRLSPEKLGSVEVRLQVDSKGKTTANFVVEHAETLGLLKQDSNQLLQSLQNAGIDTNGASLSFSLRDPNTGTTQNQSNGSQGRQAGGGAASAIDGTGTEDQPAIASNRLYDIKA